MRRLARGKTTRTLGLGCSWSARITRCGSPTEACVARDKKSGSRKNILGDRCEILKTHLLGIEFLMMLNENGAVKAFHRRASPCFHNPAETRRRCGGGGTKGRARGSKRCRVKNHNSLCFIKLYGCLMTPRAVGQDAISLQYWGMKVLALQFFIFLFLIYSKRLIRCAKWSHSLRPVVTEGFSV